ncbi:hypothetical protein [Streptomyces sp. NBC_00083]|uniref:hypothetical protein n=1 Tax=Streptomyces sp. NBC_00083 TaxID=2975647 RepID=UPI0022539B52|nr:hypothetical protein [Streptomyces sp. NBC_00083]MCX5382726.1 hypothetical protein [Streptomyces sp. NBC_00083]
MILLVSADPGDPATAGFAAYLAGHAIPHAVCSDPCRLGFGLDVDTRGRTRARVYVPGHDPMHGDEVAVFLRDPWLFAAADESSEEGRFAANEYRAALWTLCASLPEVINRPGPQAWPHDRELRRCLDGSALLPECWTTDPGRLLERWDACATPEMHVEDLLTQERWIAAEHGVLRSGRPNPASGHLRAVFAPSSRYVVEVCVGPRTFTVLNEPDADVDAEPHRRFMRDLATALRRRGVRFFAVALVYDGRRRLAVSRILPDPPFSWYRAHSDAVHEQLCTELAHPVPADLEAVR